MLQKQVLSFQKNYKLVIIFRETYCNSSRVNGNKVSTFVTLNIGSDTNVQLSLSTYVRIGGGHHKNAGLKQTSL